MNLNRWKPYNPNPVRNQRVGDCAIRAICKATGQDWENYTVEEFSADHQNGVFVLGLDGHVVTVVDGFYWDTWDSGQEIPIYYWERR